MFDDAVKIGGDVGACDDEAERKVRRGRDRFQDRGQALHAPVVADEQEHKIIVGKFAPKARALTPREAGGDRKLNSVDAVENHGHIFAAEADVEQICCAMRNGGEPGFGISVHDALESGDRRVVQGAMQSAWCAASGFGDERLLRLLRREFAQSLKHYMDDDEVAIEAVDAGGQDEVDALCACEAMPPTHRRVSDYPE